MSAAEDKDRDRLVAEGLLRAAVREAQGLGLHDGEILMVMLSAMPEAATQGLPDHSVAVH